MTPPPQCSPPRLAAEQFPICVPASCPLKLLSAATVSWCWAGQSILIFSTQHSHCSLCHTPHYCAGIVIQQAVYNSTQQLLTVGLRDRTCAWALGLANSVGGMFSGNYLHTLAVSSRLVLCSFPETLITLLQ